jgi:uncharacterized protein (TIGR02246 family)
MDGDAKRAADEAAIRACVETWLEGCRRRDAERIMSVCAPDLVTFECHSVFRLDGAPAYRRFLEACFPYMQGDMEAEIEDVDVAVDGDLGVCRYVGRFKAHDLEGQVHVSWLRGTTVFRRTGESWLAAHAHLSAPFDPMTEKVMLNRESAFGSDTPAA